MRFQEILSGPMPEMAYAKKGPAALADRLRRFHRTFAELCARGAMTDLEIEALVDRFVRGEPVDAA